MREWLSPASGWPSASTGHVLNQRCPPNNLDSPRQVSDSTQMAEARHACPPAPRVVVVGAGPCGSALALRLARAGVVVELIEALAPHQLLPRGEGLMPSGLEALRRLELEGALAGVARMPLRSWDFWLEQRPLFAVAEPIGGGEPCSLIRTPQLLEALLAEARRCPSLRWHPGRRVSGLIRETEGSGANRSGAAGGRGDANSTMAGHGDRIASGSSGTPAAGPGDRVCGVTLSDGGELRADLVLACDGRGSTLRQLAGLALEHERHLNSQPVSVLWFALEGPAVAELVDWLDGRFLTLVAQGESLAVYAPTGGGLRLGWLLEGGAEDGDSDPAIGTDWREAWARLSPPELAALWRVLPAQVIPEPVRVPIQPALATRWQKPGLLLLGDAAHPMSPLRAQGLNMALRDAVVAGERLLPLLQPEAWTAASPGDRQARLDQALVAVEWARRPEIVRIQALQREELDRALLLRRSAPLRRLLAATAPLCGPLLSRRWQAGQPTLRRGLPLG